jgi:predicted nucleic acid-binding protein
LAIRQHPKALDVLNEAIQSRSLLISVISIAEIYTKLDPKDEAIISALTSKFPPYPVDMDVAIKAAKIKSLQKPGTGRKQMLDCLVAATAKVKGAKLITFDKGFSSFKGLDLKILEF